MQKLHFSISIDAKKERVWESMLGDAGYRKWTEAFAPGSYFEGNWEKGSTMRFLAPKENGDVAGISSRIAENKPHEFISIEHLGTFQNGQEDLSSDEVKTWAGAHDNYTFKEENGQTTVFVDLDVEEQYKEMFEVMWPNALKRLKELAETMIPITVKTTVNAPLQKVWEAWTKPEHITKWAFASDDWEALSAENNLQTGGSFKTRMAAKDGSVAFDFEGVYSLVEELKTIEYNMPDQRHVKITFNPIPEGVEIIETFDAENTFSQELQRKGWQAILDHFKKYAETL